MFEIGCRLFSSHNIGITPPPVHHDISLPQTPIRPYKKKIPKQNGGQNFLPPFSLPFPFQVILTFEDHPVIPRENGVLSKKRKKRGDSCK